MTDQRTVRVAVIGDVHGAWDEEDVEYFDDSDYDVVLFVGDIGSYRHKQTLAVARRIARLRKRAILIPGNHDAVLAAQLVAEVVQSKLATSALGFFGTRLQGELARALGSVEIAGYSVHELASHELSVIAARPHSMGGPGVAFGPLLKRRFGITDLDSSCRRLEELVEGCRYERVLFLAHNGPTGFGGAPTDIWGCDFKEGGGDFGDADLEHAIAHARRRGKRVLAVVAGHMHHRVKGGGTRTWQVTDAGTLYLNAARVPRVLKQSGKRVRHHVRLLVFGDDAQAEEVLVPERE